MRHTYNHIYHTYNHTQKNFRKKNFDFKNLTLTKIYKKKFFFFYFFNTTNTLSSDFLFNFVNESTKEDLRYHLVRPLYD